MNNENELNELKPPVLDGYTKIPTFKLWVANRFPYMETDFDGLTNYELLEALTNYLNNVIKNEENVESNVAKLNQAYLELFNYVKDYFDNLDVQEEINNKLDEMAQDGTLQEIIADYLDTKAVFGFNTVADMKTATNLINGSYVETYGFYSINDGGNAKYKVRTITNNDIVDEMFIIALNDDNLIAELINDTPNKFNVLKLGVKRNIHESQNSKITSIISKLTNGDTLFFPTGEYYFTEKITLLNRIGLEGEILSTGERDVSFNGTRLFFDLQISPESRYTLLDCSQNNKTSIRNIYIYSNSYNLSCDRTLQSADTSKIDTFTATTNTPNIEGVRLSSYGSEMRNVIIRGCSSRAVFVGKYNLLDNVRVYECNYGFTLENDNTINDCNCFTCNIAMLIDGPINLINNFRADEVKRGIWCYKGNNNISNFTIDYALFNAIQLEGSNNNFISGNIGRVGTYYAEKGSNTPIESCYVGVIKSNYNTIIINVTRRNTTDTSTEILNPCYSIVTRNTCLGNIYELTGEPTFLDFTKDRLTIAQLKNLLTIQDGTNSDTVRYYDFTYSFNETTNSYDSSSIKYSDNLIKYSEGEVFNKTIPAGNNTTISFEMNSASTQSFLVMITKNGTSQRGLYLLGYSTATATLVTETIVELPGVSFTRSGSTITISGLVAWSSAQIISNNNFN